MPPRAQFRDTALLRGPGGILTVAPLGATAAVYEVGSVQPIGDTIWADESSMLQLPNPMPTGTDGLIDFWLDIEREFDLVVTCAGYGSVRATVTADSAKGWQESATFNNPTLSGQVSGQPQWLTPQYLTVASAVQPYIDHNTLAALSTTDPHTQYLTPTRGDARYDALGAASTGDANHVAASDPHAQYQLQSESDARYLQLTGGTLSGPLQATQLSVSAFEQLAEIATPAVPPGGQVRFYPKSDHRVYLLDSSGNETVLNPGTGAAQVVSLHDEFTPTAGATTVTTGQPMTACLIVARNGVVQSASAGHYSVTGSVITFSTAFVAGERVVVAYQANGTATGEDVALRTYIRGIMATLDPTGPPAP